MIFHKDSACYQETSHFVRKLCIHISFQNIFCAWYNYGMFKSKNPKQMMCVLNIFLTWYDGYSAIE